MERKFFFSMFIFVLSAAIGLISCGGGKWVVTNENNVETKKWVEKNKTKYMIKYTLANDRIIKGEHFKGEGPEPTIVRTVQYNSKGLPVALKHKGKVDLKVKVVDDEYEIKYTYNSKGYLKTINRKNQAAYTITTNVTPLTKTEFKYDSSGRVKTVEKFIGTGLEITEYSYASGNNISKLVYKKVGFSTALKKIMVTEIITTQLKGVPWNGSERYIDGFSDFVSKISRVSIYDNEAKVEKMNLGINFSSALEVGKLLNNEKSGPKWRMGDLPDPPKPFSENPVSWY